MNRSILFKTAVILHLLSSLGSIIGPFPALMGGPQAQRPTQGIPQIVMLLAALLGAAGVISSYGAWYGQKWGIWLTIIVEATDGMRIQYTENIASIDRARRHRVQTGRP